MRYFALLPDGETWSEVNAENQIVVVAIDLPAGEEIDNLDLYLEDHPEVEVVLSCEGAKVGIQPPLEVYHFER